MSRALWTVVLVLAGAVLAFAPASAPAQELGGSAVTVSGTGPFADLRVTVGQTRDLINQAITVSWTGGASTQPNTGQFAVNYLQIMQCWGDDAGGPKRSQCLFGGTVTQSTPAAGAWVRSRQVNYAGLVDPAEPLRPGDDPDTPDVDESRENVFVPFWAYGTPEPNPAKPAYTGRSDFIDAQLTNEIPLARTRANGAGVESFEVQTARQSPGLGCGEPVRSGNTTSGRSCWLVVVPRGSSEVDGSDQSARELVSSPLSASNWANRIAVRLDFQPVGSACPLGAAERRLLGHELAVEAVSRWQPALCTRGGALFGLTQLSDDVVRNQLLQSDDPGLAMLSEPVPPDDERPDRPLVYAPVAVSGLTVAYYIERQVPPDASEEDKLRDGERFTDLKLTPRLVAKLLTQSYRGSVVGNTDHIAGNPAGLADDPEFLDLNPSYKGSQYWTTISDALVALPTQDANALLWRWVLGDADAKTFLAGAPDEHGMVVNPNNKNLTLPAPTFPRNDQTCYEADPRFRFCTLDAHPFANDMHEAGRAIGRGDSLGRTASGTPNPDGTPKLSKTDRQSPGRHGLLAVVDAATAARYGLQTARLRNNAGTFVGPTADGLLSSVATMTPSSVPGVLAPNPATTASTAYPLTSVTYAATAPNLLTQAAGKDYASFLRYAAGPGQEPGLEPGQLPDGYAPLPNALREQTLRVATSIENQAWRVTAVDPAGQPGDMHGGGDLGAGTGAVGPDGVPLPGANAPAPTQDQGPPGRDQVPVAQTRRTPATPLGVIRYVLAAILIGGGLAAASSPVLVRLSTGRRGDAAGG
ncbi:hypothetical protein [Actinophytocola sp.]|uniref:hypothetical protein n=1 Tax=Actinophytocola sp. TaxID=1872138 RepID=UPI002ED68AB5